MTNIGVSLAEDVSVAGSRPWPLLFPSRGRDHRGILLVVGVVVAWFALSRIQRGWLALRRWLRRRTQESAADSGSPR